MHKFQKDDIYKLNNNLKLKKLEMKKLVFLACFMAVSSFMACTANKTESNATANDSTAVDTTIVDSLDSALVDSMNVSE